MDSDTAFPNKPIVEHILSQHFAPQPWQIERPTAGLQKEAYVVQSERQKLFLKFDTDGRAWGRLAQLGATPPLLASGSFEGRPYIIQAFAEGVHPDRSWFAQHPTALARFMRSYHDDQLLAQILSGPERQGHGDHVRQEVAALAEAIRVTTWSGVSSHRFRRAFALFREQARQLRPVQLVPVHADPSPANFLVTPQGMTMVDWDEALLSDPMHDVGLVLWWYLPQPVWPAFSDAYRGPVDRDAIFWWVARRSLQVALWFDAGQTAGPAQAFLDDFYRAVRQEENPQVGSGEDPVDKEKADVRRSAA